MKKILAVVMIFVGGAFVFTYLLGGGLASLMHIDFSSGDSYQFGVILGQLLAALVGIALVYYGFKFWTEKKWVFVVFLVALGIGLWSLQIGGPKDSDIISGATRTDFVNGTIQGCTESMNSNQGTTVSAREKNSAFCNCYANKIADGTTNEDIAAVKKNASVPPEMQPRLDSANQSCNAYLQ